MKKANTLKIFIACLGAIALSSHASDFSNLTDVRLYAEYNVNGNGKKKTLLSLKDDFQNIPLIKEKAVYKGKNKDDKGLYLKLQTVKNDHFEESSGGRIIIKLKKNGLLPFSRLSYSDGNDFWSKWDPNRKKIVFNAEEVKIKHSKKGKPTFFKETLTLNYLKKKKTKSVYVQGKLNLVDIDDKSASTEAGDDVLGSTEVAKEAIDESGIIESKTKKVKREKGSKRGESKKKKPKASTTTIEPESTESTSTPKTGKIEEPGAATPAKSTKTKKSKAKKASKSPKTEPGSTESTSTPKGNKVKKSDTTSTASGVSSDTSKTDSERKPFKIYEDTTGKGTSQSPSNGKRNAFMGVSFAVGVLLAKMAYDKYVQKVPKGKKKA